MHVAIGQLSLSRLLRSLRWKRRRQPGGIEWARGQCIDAGRHNEIGFVQAADLPGGQRYVAEAPSQREFRVVPDFFCQRTHRVSECQRGAIVVKLEATRDTACRRVKFPIGNLGELGCTLFARERLDPASARIAGTLRELRHVTASSSCDLDPVVPTDNQLSPEKYHILDLRGRPLQCPLWVKSGHWSTSAQCPLYPQKRTLIEPPTQFNELIYVNAVERSPTWSVAAQEAD